jgi:ubiquinone/menaquinone biosynthesis C-methylase UbiE
MEKQLLDKLTLGSDDIYSSPSWGQGQEVEIELRKKVADSVPVDLAAEISIHHSFSVMDREVELFVKELRPNAVIIDVGGCWGWHWRDLHKIRPDLSVVIVDMVRENLVRSKFFLRDQINKSVFLVHGDGTKLPFDDDSVDAYWAVQTLQHIPVLESALGEARRILKPGAVFVMYNLNNPWAVRLIYKLLGRAWVDEGSVSGMFFLRRSGRKDRSLVRKIFGNVTSQRFTEIIFTPEFNLHGSAFLGSWLGKIDAWLSSGFIGWSLIARQRSYSAIKLKDY